MRTTYFGMFEAKHLLKAHTPVGRFVTSTRVWNEQPKAGESPVRPIAGVATSRTHDRGMLSGVVR